MSEHQYIVFSLNEEQFGLNIEIVHEIVQLPKIVKLPQSSELIEGIINLRGTIIPVVDLKKHFYGQATEKQETTRIIIVELDDWEVGIIVDSVADVKSLTEEQIALLPPFVQRITAGACLKGIGKTDDGLVILLDFSKVFNPEEKNMLQEAVN